MRSLLYTFFSSLVLMVGLPAFAQQGSWPKLISTGAGTEIKIFEIQPQSLNGNNLDLQAAVSVKETAASEPVFGMMWAKAVIEKDQYNQVSRFSKLEISKLKVPGVTEDDDVSELQSIIENELPRYNLNIPVGELQAQLETSERQSRLAGNINNNPPKVIFTKTSSILVFIDGEPQVQKNAAWGVEQVVNTPFTIIKNNDQRYYLYGNKKWFSASSIHGNWSYLNQVPQNLSAIDAEVRKADTSVVTDNTIPNVIVTTVPAELIQSKGEPNFAPVPGTNLLYMTNTNNDIFNDINSQHYYVLISGRWYKAPNLNSRWTYTGSNELPEDFVKIPEGSAKDAVLASIAGTPAAEESVLDAQIPQTAKVDRNSATASVDYDGEPQFEPIEGTDLEYAVNTPGAVIADGRKYYYVENGVWFESNNPNGPWLVATERPDEVANIPPTSPVYNVKYVYIYDATPEYVYMGYTPGYLGTYVYGPTIVYGTGYHYRPWRGRYYYARPLTWGFNMRYNPWSGWNIGFGYGTGWFYSEIGGYNYFGHRVNRSYFSSYGWWGPTAYRPQYGRRNGNYYGGNVIINNNYIVSNNRYNNVYRSRRDVVTYDRSRNEGSRYYRNTGGYAQNNNRSGGYNNGNTNRPGIEGRNGNGGYNNSNNGTQRPGRFGGIQQRRSDNGSSSISNNRNSSNNNSTTQRPGRFGGIRQRTGSSDGNITDNRNNENRNNNNEAANRLQTQRQARIGRPQEAAGNSSGNISESGTNGNRNGTDRPGNFNNRIVNRRNNDISQQGSVADNNNANASGRNNPVTIPPVNSNDNINANRPARQYNPQPRFNQQQSNDDVRSSRNPGFSRDVNRQEVNRQEVNRTEQPARVYTPQRSMESPRVNNAPIQRQQEVRRSAENPPAARPEVNRGSNEGVNRTFQSRSSEGSNDQQGSSGRRRLGSK